MIDNLTAPARGHVATLRAFFHDREPGPISDDTGQLERLLFSSWNELEKEDDGGMTADKLSGRMESVSWEPPLLLFTIERHGAFVRGSTRAELQDWAIDMDRLSASYSRGRFRQLQPRQASLNVDLLAKELSETILRGGEDSRLKWYPDGRVQVLVGKVIPGIGARQTIEGRRKRFREAMEGILLSKGYTRIRPHVYVAAKPPAGTEAGG